MLTTGEQEKTSKKSLQRRGLESFWVVEAGSRVLLLSSNLFMIMSAVYLLVKPINGRFTHDSFGGTRCNQFWNFWSKLKTTVPRVGISTDSRKIPVHLSRNPGMAKSVIFSLPAVYATALGGVAMGSMKEKEEAMVAVTMRKSGWMLSERETSASNGRKMVAVALLDVNSVTMATIIATEGVMRM